MNTNYQIIDRTDKAELTKFLAKEGQFLLPVLDSILTAQAAVYDAWVCLVCLPAVCTQPISSSRHIQEFG